MITDFLYKLNPVFAQEERDLDALCSELSQNDCFVGFMPAAMLDFWPIYNLGCTHASRFTGASARHKVYIMPIDVCDRAIYPSLCREVRDFYTDAQKAPAEKKKFSFRRLFSRKKPLPPIDLECGIKTEEIIPLSLPSLGGSYPLHLSKDCECNVLYMRLILPNLNNVHLFAVCASPEKVWRGVIENFEIRTDMIIHSRKSFGHWFNSTELYKYLKSTKKPHLLPRFYFKGRFIKENDAPHMSVAEETIEDDIRCGNSIIYRLPERLT